MLKSLIVLAILLAAWWASAGCAACCATDDQPAELSLAAETQSNIAGAREADEDEAGEDAGDDEGDEADEGEDQAIALDQVPSAVLDAARAALPGVVLTSAELEQEDGQFLYSLSGMLGDERVEIEVTPDGRVLEIERGGE
jgi:hypothetical protein